MSSEIEMEIALNHDRISMLKDKEIINLKDARGWPIQHVAASEGHLEAVTGLNQPEVLAQRNETFDQLFNFYEQNCVPDMEKALPIIKKKFRSEKEKKSARRKRNLCIVSMVFGLFLVLGLPTGIWYWLKTFSWENLTIDQKVTVQRTSINYLSCEVKFGNIFSESSLIYTNLTSSQILGALWGSPFEFPKTVDEEMEKFIHLNGSNVPECLEAFELLDSSQIVQILKGKETFNISHQLEQKAKFYVERKFADEKCLEKEYHDEGKWYDYASGTLTCCIKCPRSNISEIFDVIQDSRLFFLSSPAGQGKSTNFHHFGLKLKEKWPQKWVEFVDLKENLEAFEIGSKTEFNTTEVLENFLANTLLNLTDFESTIFAEKFQNGDLIFLWDGIDEISPFFKEFMLDLTSKYKKLTENWQFVSTRPQSSAEFQKNLNISAFALVPLDEEKKFEFLVKFSLFDQFELDVDESYESIRPFLNFSLPIDQILTDLRNSNAFPVLNETKVEKIIRKIKNGDKILKSIENSDKKVSPILIEMAVEEAENENFIISQNFNTFSLYENFVDKKFDIVVKKGDVVANNLNKWIKVETLTYSKAHQAFALKTIFYSDVSLNYLNKKIEKVLQKKSNVEISRFGILNVNSEDDFDFVHRTFAEFFAANFLIDNLIENFTLNNDFEITFFLGLVTEVIVDGKFPVVRKFIMDFLDLNQNKNLDFAKYLREHNLRFEKLKEITKDRGFVGFFQVVDFSYYFVEKYKISTQLIKSPYYDLPLSYEILLSNWEKVVEIFGEEKIRLALEIRDWRGWNLLVHFCAEFEINTALLSQMLKLYEENFNQTQLKELLVNRKKNQNVLMLAAECKDVEFVEILWNFMKKNLKAEEIREILKMEEELITSALENSIWKDNEEMFLFVKKIYNETLTRDEIKEIILSFDEDYFPTSFIAGAVNYEVCIEISKFLFEFFKDEILTLKSLFKRRAKKDYYANISKGETILSFIKIKKRDEKCFEFYKEKWRTFYENEESFEAEFKEMLND